MSSPDSMRYLRRKPGSRRSGAAGALLLAVTLAACIGPRQVVEQPPPVYHIEPGVLRSMDAEILTASGFARHEAEAFARVTMDAWRERVRRSIEEAFIPWYADYWTQQGIALRVAWYRMTETEGEPAPDARLAGYLQEEFHDRVLEPVSEMIDPRDVMEETTDRYRRELACLLEPLPHEYAVPAAAFKQHLDAIPAIVVTGEPPLEASLLEVLRSTDLPALPAYAGLLREIAGVNGHTGPHPQEERLRMVARRAVTRLVETLPVRGGAAAASTVVGGFWGVMITLGSGVWGAMEHDRDRPRIEAQLRENLDAALEIMWREMVEDREHGVGAVVYHMGSRIESELAPPEPPRTAPLPGELF